MYEQQYVEPVGAVAALANGSRPQLLFGSTDAQPLLPVGDEVFGLRKLLPTSVEYDFNMHVMTFEPGEFLTVKEVHYNQHGLLLLDGHGIYRLADKWRVRAAAAGAALLALTVLALAAGIRSRRAMPSGWRPSWCSGTARWARRSRATSSTRTRTETRCRAFARDAASCVRARV
jgi:hypothetical protein